MKYLDNYLARIDAKGNPALSEAIRKTTGDIVPQYISNFSYKDHVVSLLVGDVQSGKTSHMFGLMCAAADEGFGIFVLLTTDNILLQQQTFKRAEKDLCDFCICDENDYLKFTQNNMRKPAVIVLKKNGRVLKQWKNNFSSTQFVAGNPLFIVDDEADAASLNTQVNKNKQSTINKCLDEIKRTTSSSIYMQVTGTPQSILLQTEKSGWKPYFIYYFRPGKGYMGGNFFFNDEHPNVILTDNTEATELLDDDEFPENGLKTALVMHLISAAHIFLNGGTVCNFLIHPSFKTSEHKKFAEKIGEYLNECAYSQEEATTRDAFLQVYKTLQATKSDLKPFEEIYTFIFEQMASDKVNILVLNSITSFEENTQYETGINIIVGGNSLGRGVTFPQLQTIYYCRVAKSPQADTMWQHARMFGYDRDPALLRVFMPPKLFKLFSDINTTNNSIIAQIEGSKGNSDIRIFYPNGLKPTRKNVLDKKLVGMLSGGVNYFPFEPTNTDIDAISEMLAAFTDDIYSVSLKMINSILGMVGSDGDDWSAKTFIGFIKTFIAENPLAQGKLIVRRERNIAKGTGTLLSPNDRKLGDEYSDEVVLTMYQVTGEKGWNGQKLWIPNIKLPNDNVYYNVSEEKATKRESKSSDDKEDHIETLKPDKTVKALSILPEYAAEIFDGIKTIEYRTWKTDYRGDLLICASSKKRKGFICGHALCMAELVDIVPISNSEKKEFGLLSTDTLYGWKLQNVRQIIPFPCKGKLHIFEVDAALVQILSPINTAKATEEWTTYYKPLIEE